MSRHAQNRKCRDRAQSHGRPLRNTIAPEAGKRGSETKSGLAAEEHFHALHLGIEVLKRREYDVVHRVVDIVHDDRDLARGISAENVVVFGTPLNLG
jgi:hypothetical protein